MKIIGKPSDRELIHDIVVIVEVDTGLRMDQQGIPSRQRRISVQLEQDPLIGLVGETGI